MSAHLSHSTLPARLAAVFAVVFALALSAWQAALAQSSTILVTTNQDNVKSDGFCSLREAVIAANKDAKSSSKAGECPAGSGADVIEIPAGIYVLTRTDNGKEDSGSTGDLDITSDVTIVAQGRVVITAVGGFTDRIFHVISGTVTLDGLTISGGRVAGDGGAIYSLGNLTILNSTLTGNRAGGSGGAIASAGTLTAANLTLSGNWADRDGGGLYVSSGQATLNNLTIASNTADADNAGGGNGGGIARAGGVVTISNSIVADNADHSATIRHDDCTGTLTSNGYNLIQATTGCTFAGPGTADILGQNPGLAPLAENGGPTQTRALMSGSPAIDAGNPAAPGSGGSACEQADQRGAPRPNAAACDIGALEADTPVLIRAYPGGGGTTVVGRIQGVPNTQYTLTVVYGQSCDASDLTSTLGTHQITTDEFGNAYFDSGFGSSLSTGTYLAATAIVQGGTASPTSACVIVSAGNDSWPQAMPLDLGSGSASVDQFIDMPGQSRWFRFAVQPDSQLTITLTNLPANYDLTLYSDIAAAYANTSVDSQQALLQLGAQYAQDAFAPNAFSPDALSPNAFSPNAFSPNAFSPNAFSPNAFSPDAFSPNAFSPNAFSPDALSPDAFSPNAFSPNAFSPNAFSPNAFSPNAFSPNAFSSAQTLSLIGVSAFDGTASEGLRLNTWTSTGDFYLRVRGRHGAFSLASPFHLAIQLVPGSCQSVGPVSGSSLAGLGDGYRTLILTDSDRLGEPADSPLWAKLGDLAAEVDGVIIDLSQDQRVQAANDQADDHAACPVAKNIVAEAIKQVVDNYRDQNPVEYIVLVGNDEVIPFFRYPDGALLGNETNFYPPVRDDTASQASLRLGYVLGQDAYGASVDLMLQDHSLPVAEIPVGRLAETAQDIIPVIEAYLDAPLVTPGSSLVTGYDFLEDAAHAVEAQLAAGTGSDPDTLIAPNHLSPESNDPRVWSADDLQDALLGSPHDLIFLAGHFSANSALAADYASQLLTTDLEAAPEGWFSNTIIFSAGCHAGYNIVNQHGIPVITFEPDWAQAFARQGATLIGGTGYQYGDTDFIEYSERLYVEFSRQLRAGSGAVSIGEALVRAKQLYLAGTPQMRGIHEKAYLEATLFGLPMLSVDMQGERLGGGGPASIVTSTSGFSANPGATLGLRSADINLPFSLTMNSLDLKDPETGDTIATAQYLSGFNDVLANPSEPVLPLEISNVSVSGTVLRGAGFRGGSFEDLPDILPLTAAPATEIRGVHTPFLSDVFYPVRPWAVNYFGAIADSGGPTYLAITPAQVWSSTPGSQTVTLRQFDDMQFRLFYSSYGTAAGQNTLPAEADAPTIVSVSSEVSGEDVVFQVRVNGNPAAGIQQVWVTYFGFSGPFFEKWQSLDLAQSSADSTIWQGVLPLQGSPPSQIRFLAQAVNGVGLVSMDTNQGAFYTPGVSGEPTIATDLQFTSAPAQGAYGERPAFSARLTDSGGPLAGQLVTFGIGPVTRQAFTDGDGMATAALPLLALPGDYQVRATFGGTAEHIAAFAVAGFTITKQGTTLDLNPDPADGLPGQPGLVTASLRDAAGVYLGEKMVIFVVHDGSGPQLAQAVITDYAGRASLGAVPLGPGAYTVKASFAKTVSLPGGETAVLYDQRYQGTSASVDLVLIDPAPAAADDAYTVAEDGTLEVAAPGVLENDTDPDSPALTAVLVAGPGHGTLTLNPDGSFTYTPEADFNGEDSFTYRANDGSHDSGIATVTITVEAVNDLPDCSAAHADVDSLWPPDKSLIPVSIVGVTDPDEGDLITIEITGVFQDEPVGGTPTAFIQDPPSTVLLTADRDGSGNGRVYHVFFTATDNQGGECSGEVMVPVAPHDQSGTEPVDDGPLYDAVNPGSEE